MGGEGPGGVRGEHCRTPEQGLGLMALGLQGRGGHVGALKGVWLGAGTRLWASCS